MNKKAKKTASKHAEMLKLLKELERKACQIQRAYTWLENEQTASEGQQRVNTLTNEKHEITIKIMSLYLND